MALKKKKLTKKIWYELELWDLVEVRSPTPFDDYLILQRKDEECVHEDGTTPIIMIMLHAQNDIFYPNTKKVRKMLDEERQMLAKLHHMKHNFDSELSEQWLACFKRETKDFDDCGF